jgi:hypothetical protein
MEQQKGLTDKKESFVVRVLEWIALIAVCAFVLSFGWIFLWPFFGTLAAGFIAYRLIHTRLKPLVPALAVQGGQLIWLIAGLTVVWFDPGQIKAITGQGAIPGIIADGLLMSGFIMWIGLRPGWTAVSLATLYQASNLVVHWLNIVNGTEVEQKGLIMHMILNALIIGCLLLGWLWTEKPQPTVVQAAGV